MYIPWLLGECEWQSINLYVFGDRSHRQVIASFYAGWLFSPRTGVANNRCSIKKDLSFFTPLQ